MVSCISTMYNVIPDDDVWCVVFGTLVGVSVLNVVRFIDNIGDQCPSVIISV